MNKKAQLAVFVFFGIIILITLSFMAYINFKSHNLIVENKIENELFYQSSMIKNKIDTCLATLTDKGMKIMSSQGFYLYIPESKKYDNTTAYWLIDTVNVMPPKFDDIENELESYILSNMENCTDFQEFIDQGWLISPFDPTIDVQFYEEDVNTNANYIISIEKEDFKRTLINSVYIPNIRFRDMYIKAADFINNQLLKAEFDLTDPLKDYDSGSYVINYQDLSDNKTLLFTITDPESKVIDGSDFTLKFATSFAINDMVRTYDVSNSNRERILYSPDRLLVIILPPGASSSSDTITIRQYNRSSVTRENTPKTRTNWDVTEEQDITFNTDYPIYRIGPSGTSFDPMAILVIYLNEDQFGLPSDYTLIWNGVDSWQVYPHHKETSEAIVSATLLEI